MNRNTEPFLLNTYELARRAGEMKEYQLDIAAHTRIGVPLIAVPEGDVIEVDARLESVTEGILFSAQIYAVALGVCIRCLDPVEIVIDRKIQELKDAKDLGSKIALPIEGIGNANKMPQELFVYLSRRLYEEFQYINPGSTKYKEVMDTINSMQNITDEEILQIFDEENDPFKCKLS